MKYFQLSFITFCKIKLKIPQIYSKMQLLFKINCLKTFFFYQKFT